MNLLEKNLRYDTIIISIGIFGSDSEKQNLNRNNPTLIVDPNVIYFFPTHYIIVFLKHGRYS